MVLGLGPKTIGIALAALLVVAAAGYVGVLGGGGGGGCGPGETKITNLDPESAEQTSITGEVTVVGPASVNVDDGSGVAFVRTGPHDLSEGDCVTAQGTVNLGDPSTGLDATFGATNVSQV